MLLLFFAIPLATIILSAIFETLIHSPLKIAGIAFSVFLITAFSFNITIELLIAVIAYTALSFISSYITDVFYDRAPQNNNMGISNEINRRRNERDFFSSRNDNNCTEQREFDNFNRRRENENFFDINENSNLRRRNDERIVDDFRGRKNYSDIDEELDMRLNDNQNRLRNDDKRCNRYR